MKKISLIIFLIGFISNCLSQNITFNELKFIYQNSLEKSNDLLLKKGFDFYETKENDYDDDFTTTWAYHGNKSRDTAIAFIAKSCSKKECNIVWYQVPSTDVFNSIKFYCKEVGYNLIKTEKDSLGNINFI